MYICEIHYFKPEEEGDLILDGWGFFWNITNFLKIERSFFVLFISLNKMRADAISFLKTHAVNTYKQAQKAKWYPL